ncbi:polysaccharide biosynthesis tyrosine autokinase [Actinotalea caeni]
MTLRQVLDVLWKRIWIIAVVTLVAVGSAAGYLAIRDVSYETRGTIRLNAVVTEAVASGELGGVAVDLDTETITAPLILDPAAEAAGEPAGALDGAIEASFREGERTGRIVINGTGPTPAAAQSRTEAVIEVYRAYLDEQLAVVDTTLRERHSEAVAEAQDLQAEVGRDPTNSIAATNLGIALARMSSIQTTLDEIATAGPASTVLDVVYPGRLVEPGRAVVLAVAIATGLIIGIGAALIRDQFDNRLRDSDEIERISSTTSLGELRWDRSVKKMDPPLPVAARSRTNLSEGFRAVRSTLQVLLPARHAAFVVTSVGPGDGKSFASANLAVAWARAGRQVVILGGDLRRPELGTYFADAADGPGLAELLEENAAGTPVTEAAVEARLNDTQHARLRVLPSGAEPLDPADLLAGDGYAKVMAVLRSLADIVIVDSPPAMGLADASLLAGATDGAVVIATVGRSDRAMVVDAIEGLEANGVRVLGVVANRGRRRLPKSYAVYLSSDRVASNRERRESDETPSPDRERAPVFPPAAPPQRRSERRPDADVLGDRDDSLLGGDRR